MISAIVRCENYLPFIDLLLQSKHSYSGNNFYLHEKSSTLIQIDTAQTYLKE